MKKKENIVYSTDENFFNEENTSSDDLDIPNKQQNLKVHLKRLPGNRIMTVVAGFHGNDKTLVELSKILKKSCGVGGSIKNNQILIQGKHREKIMNILIERGFKVKASGG